MSDKIPTKQPQNTLTAVALMLGVSVETITDLAPLMQAHDTYLKHMNPQTRKCVAFCLKRRLFEMEADEMEQLLKNPDWPHGKNDSSN